MEPLYYLAAYIILVVSWTNVIATPFIILPTCHFIAMYLIAKGAK